MSVTVLTALRPHCNDLVTVDSVTVTAVTLSQHTVVTMSLPFVLSVSCHNHTYMYVHRQCYCT